MYIMCTITGPIILFTTLTTHTMLQMIHIKSSQLRKVFFAYSKTNLLCHITLPFTLLVCHIERFFPNFSLKGLSHVIGERALRVDAIVLVECR